MRWRGKPLMKNVFDFAIYPVLIAELRPRTVFEIGSGSGASAAWFADLLALSGPDGRVHSVDIAEVQMQHPRVHFYKGDCSSPDTLFPGDLLQTAPHPWLVVEDAHHNVSGVLDLLHHFLIPGDYLVVEDSDVKPDATCAADSIFVRVGKGASDVAADQDETIMTHNGSNQIQLPLGDSDARQRLLQPSGRRRALDRSRLFRPR